MSVPEHIAKLFAILGANYPNWNASSGTVQVYAQALYDLDPDAVLAAGWQFIRASVFPPTVAEIRDLAQRQRVVLPLGQKAASFAAALHYLKESNEPGTHARYAEHLRGQAAKTFDKYGVKLGDIEAANQIIAEGHRAHAAGVLAVMRARARGEIDGHGMPEYVREQPLRLVEHEEYDERRGGVA